MEKHPLAQLTELLTRAIAEPEAVFSAEELRCYVNAASHYLEQQPDVKAGMAETLGVIALRELNRRMGVEVRTIQAVLTAAYPRQSVSGSVPGAHGTGDGPAKSGSDSTSLARDIPPTKH